MKPLLTLNNICFSYNTGQNNETHVLNKINLTINQNEIISVIGPNGCGKSTLLAIICGLLTPHSGCIKINGSHIGHMLSIGNLFEWRTTYRNGYNCYDQTKAADTCTSKNLFLHDKKQFHNNPLDTSVCENTCSGCNIKNCLKRRAALIKTLSFEPDLLLLDEPFFIFDLEGRLSLAHDIRKMLSNEQKTAILTTNNLEEAILFSDKIIILSKKPAHITEQIKIPASVRRLAEKEDFCINDFNKIMTSTDCRQLVQQVYNSSSTF